MLIDTTDIMAKLTSIKINEEYAPTENESLHN